MKSQIRGFLLTPLYITLMFILSMTASLPARAEPSATASEVSVLADCNDPNSCFTDLSALYIWIANTRHPNAQSPLLVNIGPGVFAGVISMSCPTDGTGYVSYRGSGRGVTVIGGGNFGPCSNITVMDLTIDVAVVPSHNLQIGVWFVTPNGGGSSSWTNVEIIGNRAAWYDGVDSGGNPCPAQSVRQNHKFFSSTFKLSETAYTGGGPIDIFFSSCGDVGIWGSEIVADIGSSFTSLANPLSGVFSKGVGNIVRLFGTNIRMIGNSNGPAVNPIGLYAVGGGAIQINGGEVVSKHDRPDASVIGAWADGAGSYIRTPETSFGLGVASTGSGTITRVKATSGGIVDSPFQWPAAGNPLMGAGGTHLKSLNGQDSYVENDCPLATKCLATPGSGDKYPHLMIFSDACTGTSASTGPWFDTITNKCRGI